MLRSRLLQQQQPVLLLQQQRKLAPRISFAVAAAAEVATAARAPSRPAAPAAAGRLASAAATAAAAAPATAAPVSVGPVLRAAALRRPALLSWPWQQHSSSSSTCCRCCCCSRRGLVTSRAQLLLDLPKSEGDDFLKKCEEVAAAPAPAAGQWSLLSSVMHAKGGSLYPLQLLLLLRLFAAAPFADEALLAAVAARAEDLIAAAAPPRAVELLSLFAALGFTHPLVQQPLRQRLLQVLHLLESHHLPSALNSLSLLHILVGSSGTQEMQREKSQKQAANDSSNKQQLLLVDGLATQAALLCAAAAQNSTATTLFSCVEALSRLRHRQEDLLALFTKRLEAGFESLSLKDLLLAAAAAERYGLKDYAEALHEELLRRAPDACSSWEGLGRLLHLQHKFRSEAAAAEAAAKEAAEAAAATLSAAAVLSGVASGAPFYAANASDAEARTTVSLLVFLGAAAAPTAAATAAAACVPGALLLSPHLLAALPSLPSSSICDFAHAAALCVFQLMRSEGVEAPLQQQLLRQLDAAVLLLSHAQQRLSLQQRETLKEICFFLSALFADSAAAAAAPAAAAISEETKAFAAAAALAPAEGPLPRGPPSLDYSQLELKSVLSRKLLVAADGEKEVALHHAGVHEVYVQLNPQQPQQEQQQRQQAYCEDLEELFPGTALLQQAPSLTAAESFSVACVASAAGPPLQHRLYLLA
ncbi:hypothetical protein, conserved [Eimeria tenella]|uniref:Uncharacterized protein n=1 Tax=Eimeria tenella TaxID=5802 RepID=U6KY36_EIMTE|nr:hypothetical protein, conserved [Eimeria tenella]CDJ43062.1 hypothetical protein, conserved [Eimeria tenella]|eukprot:XP_013233812.1 hypothetical protein, conserved [Eimeria tenella]